MKKLLNPKTAFRKVNYFITLLFSIVVLTACSTYKNTYRLTDIPDNRAKVTPVVVDVEPDFTKRIKGESGKMKSLNSAKENAYYNAIVTNNVDVLVDPIYQIKSTRGLFRTTHRAMVTGYAGTYKNPRTETVENQTMFNAKLENLKKFVAVDAIAKEENKSVYIFNNNGSGCNGGSATTEKVVNSTQDLVHRFNGFSTGQIAISEEYTDKKLTEDEKPKKGGFFSKLFGGK
jgi:glycogen debranching enzyme